MLFKSHFQWTKSIFKFILEYLQNWQLATKFAISTASNSLTFCYSYFRFRHAEQYSKSIESKQSVFVDTLHAANSWWIGFGWAGTEPFRKVIIFDYRANQFMAMKWNLIHIFNAFSKTGHNLSNHCCYQLCRLLMNLMRMIKVKHQKTHRPFRNKWAAMTQPIPCYLIRSHLTHRRRRHALAITMKGKRNKNRHHIVIWTHTHNICLVIVFHWLFM